MPPRIGWEKLGVRAHNRAIVVDCACYCFSGPGIVERDRVAVAEALKAVCVSRGVCVGTDRGALAIGSPDCEFVVSCASDSHRQWSEGRALQRERRAVHASQGKLPSGHTDRYATVRAVREESVG